ncbi:MAG: class I SAM-dependent methyltransferase [Solirubrobacterales bacterium]|jgi:SAM-dependent methyltransferase
MDAVRDYYDRRAAEYDDWYNGAGLFAARPRPGWDEELSALVRVVASLSPARVLDVACGTGYLTRHLQGTVYGLDQSAAMLRAARAQAPSALLVRGDALALPFPDRAFGRVVSAHFYGHLLPAERETFVAEARAVGDELVVIDAGPRGAPPRDEWQDRVLSDGSAYRVFKRFFDGASLTAELRGGRVLHDGFWFVAVALETPSAVVRAAPQDGWGD